MKKNIFLFLTLIVILVLSSCSNEFKIDRNAKTFLNFTETTNDIKVDKDLAKKYKEKLDFRLVVKDYYTLYYYQKYNYNNILYENEFFSDKYVKINPKRNVSFTNFKESKSIFSITKNDVTEYFSSYSTFIDNKLKTEQINGEYLYNNILKKTSDKNKINFIKEYFEKYQQHEFKENITYSDFKLFNSSNNISLYKQNDLYFFIDEVFI